MAGSPQPARLFAAGLDHRSSTAMLRDRVFISDGEMPGFLTELRQAGLDQAIVLSTCDRIEVQGAHRDVATAAAAAIEVLARRASEPTAEFRRQTYALFDGAALRRIFGVAAALESQVIGEPQVLGQVKAADQLARATHMMGPELDAALQAAYAAAKRTRTETAVAQRPVTLASAAVQLARDVHGDLARCAGLLIGPGEMGELMIEHLRAGGLRSLAVTGPQTIRAEECARRLACHVVAFGDMEAPLANADIMVTALGAGKHVVTQALMGRVLARRRHRPVLIIDLGIPADADPSVERLDGVFRYDLDDLERVTMTGRISRGAAAEEAWAIVEQELALFARNQAERAAVPVILALRRHFEVARVHALRQAGGNAERATELLIKRLLHDPSEALREIAAAGEDRAAVERLLGRLFRLENDEASQRPPRTRELKT